MTQLYIKIAWIYNIYYMMYNVTTTHIKHSHIIYVDNEVRHSVYINMSIHIYQFMSQ